MLHTTSFEPQSDPLSREDVVALWSAIEQYGSEYVGIFNCGFVAGSSVGHKHMQILPRAEGRLFVDEVVGGEEGREELLCGYDLRRRLREAQLLRLRLMYHISMLSRD